MPRAKKTTKPVAKKTTKKVKKAKPVGVSNIVVRNGVEVELTPRLERKLRTRPEKYKLK
jgi:hypothetical protein